MEYFTRDSQLQPYFAYPKFLLHQPLGDTAKLVYMLLLERTRIAQKQERWRSEQGQVFVVYPVAEMARHLGKGKTVVKGALRDLEQQKLLERRRQGMYHANRIFLKQPEYSPRSGRNPAGTTYGNPSVPYGGQSTTKQKNLSQQKMKLYHFTEGESF